MQIKLKVIPKSSQNKVIPQDNNFFKIKVTSAPDKGKANQQVIKLLAQHFKTSKSNIQIIKGLTSQHKVVNINID